MAVANALAFRENAELTERLAEERLYLESEIRAEHPFREIVGDSPLLRGALRQVETVAPDRRDGARLGRPARGRS
jgi:formate hydrogenlyase transcriptional activator